MDCDLKSDPNLDGFIEHIHSKGLKAYLCDKKLCITGDCNKGKEIELAYGGETCYSETYNENCYKSYAISRKDPVELQFKDGTEGMIAGFDEVIFGCDDLEKVDILNKLMTEKQCEELASKVIQDNKPVSIKMSIKEENYDEELSKNLGAICHTGSIETRNYKSFKHLIEYEGHTWLIESTFGFQQITFDPKEGYVPHLAGFHTREINLEEEEEEPEKPTEDQIRQLFSAKFWAMKTDFSIRVYVTGFESPKAIIKYIKFPESNLDGEQEQYCSFKDFFLMFEPWKDGI